MLKISGKLLNLPAFAHFKKIFDQSIVKLKLSYNKMRSLRAKSLIIIRFFIVTSNFLKNFLNYIKLFDKINKII